MLTVFTLTLDKTDLLKKKMIRLTKLLVLMVFQQDMRLDLMMLLTLDVMNTKEITTTTKVMGMELSTVKNLMLTMMTTLLMLLHLKCRMMSKATLIPILILTLILILIRISILIRIQITTQTMILILTTIQTQITIPT